MFIERASLFFRGNFSALFPIKKGTYYVFKEKSLLSFIVRSGENLTKPNIFSVTGQNRTSPKT